MERRRSSMQSFRSMSRAKVKSNDADVSPSEQTFRKAVDRVFLKLKAKDGVLEGDRTTYFLPNQLINFLTTHRHPDIPKFEGEADVLEFAQKMCACGYIVRGMMAQHTQKMLKEGLDPRMDFVLHKQPLAFDPKDRYSCYVWRYKSDTKTSNTFMTVAMMIGVAAITMIKIWPLWLKVIVYWTSLTLLVTLTSIIAIRAVLYSIMFALGFRGLWLFPNLMNDDIPFFEAFIPLFGRGIGEETEGKREEQTKAAWDFGMMNAFVLFGLGVLFCWYIGMFDSQAIPDFVANRDELFHQFPSLAPPDYSGATEDVSYGSGMPEDMEMEASPLEFSD